MEYKLFYSYQRIVYIYYKSDNAYYFLIIDCYWLFIIIIIHCCLSQKEMKFYIKYKIMILLLNMIYGK